MNSQKKNNQDNDTLDMRTLISFCLGDVSSCPDAISKIANIYRTGDLSHKAAKHRANIFIDSRQRSIRKYVTSKAIDRIRDQRCAAYIK